MVLKAVSGVADHISNIWIVEETRNEENSASLDVTNAVKDHYKNRVATPTDWAILKPSQVSCNNR